MAMRRLARACHRSRCRNTIARTQCRAPRDSSSFGCWTRKEAVLKATGSGFSWAAREIDVGIESEFKRAALPQKPGWEAGVWSIELPTSGFAAAAVIKSGTVTPPSSTMHKLSL
ncbi:MAG: 4'-phosphopantetheinyl transferase superfamily protein [Gammaproteobacteria bacterium]|nr:4'-phosphopantetheinyl transferase superfamily protein [Gammaproteobacteria bacterium]